ncbi:transposase [Flavobacterium sp.]|jgi:putative transposase|uniref:transposase n=1 Tax=Flavobacterium sp. TaxID=239 RepID=UPI0037BEA531
MKKRKSIRLKGYDYSKNNLYFITNCVKNNLCCLGRVIPVVTGRDLSVHHPENHHPDSDYVVELNQYGLIVNEKINWLMRQYEYVDVHNYVIMPNHFHLILEIDSSLLKNIISSDDSEVIIHEMSEQKIKSVSSIMGALKTTSSNEIRKSGFEDFTWHRSFHDHIIRDGNSYRNISNYIDLNPKKWIEDRFYIKD